MNTWAPQGCLLCPLLHSLFTHDCMGTHDYMVVGLITGDDEIAYRDEVSDLAVLCRDNNLYLNIRKTKELMVDYRKRG